MERLAPGVAMSSRRLAGIGRASDQVGPHFVAASAAAAHEHGAPPCWKPQRPLDVRLERRHRRAARARRDRRVRGLGARQDADEERFFSHCLYDPIAASSEGRLMSAIVLNRAASERDVFPLPQLLRMPIRRSCILDDAGSWCGSSKQGSHVAQALARRSSGDAFINGWANRRDGFCAGTNAGWAFGGADRSSRPRWP